MNIIDMSTDGLSPEEIIELRKMLGQHIKNARENSRHKECLLCGKTGGFCKSHTIPEFCLDNIAWNGKVNSINTLIDTEILTKDSGVSNAGVFHIICRPCDGSVFQNYENESAYNTEISNTTLNQIALKNSLRDIYKHEMELEMFEASKELIKEKKPFMSFLADIFFNAQIKARKTDIKECYAVFNKAKDYLSSSNNWIRLVSYDKLDFTAPIAYQGMIALITGVNGEVINDIYNPKKSYNIEYLHLAIFPLKDSTAVIMFLDSKSERYSQFEAYIKNTSLENRLEIINRIIFLYTEDYYLSKKLDSDVMHSLEESAKTLQNIATTAPRRTLKNAVKDFDLRRDICIPNLLSKKYEVIIEG